MAEQYELLKARLRSEPKTWLVTGAAGFIGSHLAEALLELGQKVVGMDNFSTGSRRNVEEVLSNVGAERASRFTFVEADIRDLQACIEACRGAEIVLHQAALGSVPRSLADPLNSNNNNITGTLNIFLAAKECDVRRVVYASSSSAYGDDARLPKIEDRIGRPLSPYAVTKYVNELYGHVFLNCFGLENIGLRYFNVFGPRQDPDGPYAAVIPRWFGELLSGARPHINGDGETSRDFCFVYNAVRANVLAALTDNRQALGAAFNVAFSARTTLNELYRKIRAQVSRVRGSARDLEPEYLDFRPGDVRHSLADISMARDSLGYQPAYSIDDGLEITARWFFAKLSLS